MPFSYKSDYPPGYSQLDRTSNTGPFLYGGKRWFVWVKDDLSVAIVSSVDGTSWVEEAVFTGTQGVYPGGDVVFKSPVLHIAVNGANASDWRLTYLKYDLSTGTKTTEIVHDAIDRASTVSQNWDYRDTGLAVFPGGRVVITYIGTSSRSMGNNYDRLNYATKPNGGAWSSAIPLSNTSGTSHDGYAYCDAGLDDICHIYMLINGNCYYRSLTSGLTLSNQSNIGTLNSIRTIRAYRNNLGQDRLAWAYLDGSNTAIVAEGPSTTFGTSPTTYHTLVPPYDTYDLLPVTYSPGRGKLLQFQGTSSGGMRFVEHSLADGAGSFVQTHLINATNWPEALSMGALGAETGYTYADVGRAYGEDSSSTGLSLNMKWQVNSLPTFGPDTPLSRREKIGPFRYNNAFYAVTRNAPLTGENAISVWRSTSPVDNSSSGWSLLATIPTTSKVTGVNTVMNEGDLHIAATQYQENGEFNAYCEPFYYRYNVITDELEVDGVLVSTTRMVPTYPAQIHFHPENSAIRIAFENNSGYDYENEVYWNGLHVFRSNDYGKYFYQESLRPGDLASGRRYNSPMFVHNQSNKNGMLLYFQHYVFGNQRVEAAHITAQGEWGTSGIVSTTIDPSTWGDYKVPAGAGLAEQPDGSVRVWFANHDQGSLMVRYHDIATDGSMGTGSVDTQIVSGFRYKEAPIEVLGDDFFMFYSDSSTADLWRTENMNNTSWITPVEVQDAVTIQGISTWTDDAGEVFYFYYDSAAPALKFKRLTKTTKVTKAVRLDFNTFFKMDSELKWKALVTISDDSYLQWGVHVGPSAPTLISPPDGTSVSSSGPFEWEFNHPEAGFTQSEYAIYRRRKE